MKNRVLAKKKSQIRCREQVEYKAMMEALGTIGSLPALIGLWAAACFVSGMIASGGPLAMARHFFSALTGV